MSYPTRADREKCWNSKDSYWRCLDDSKDDMKACVKLRKEYENSCSAQWVKHFDRRRKYEQFKLQMDNTNWEAPLDSK